MVDTLISVAGGALCLVLGWFLRRLVGQNDAAIAQLQTRQDALRDKVLDLKADLKSHEAAHMLAGERLDRPHRRDLDGDSSSFQ